jgi:hypothetical protein
MAEDGMDCRLMEVGAAFRSGRGSPSPSCASVFRSMSMADKMNCRLMEVVTFGEWGKPFVGEVFIVGQNGASSNFRLQANRRQNGEPEVSAIVLAFY